MHMVVLSDLPALARWVRVTLRGQGTMSTFRSEVVSQCLALGPGCSVSHGAGQAVLMES